MPHSLLAILRRIARRYAGKGRRYPRRGRYSRRGSDKDTAAPPSTEALFGTLALELPVELWLEIFHHVADRQTLSHLMRVNRAFSQASELFLYRDVTLELDAAVVGFSNSLSSCPHRTSIVRGLHILCIEGLDYRLNLILPALVHSLPLLQYFTLKIHPNSTSLHPWWPPGSLYYASVLDVDLPSLRGFTTDLPLTHHKNFFINFVQKQNQLEELDLGTYHTSHSPLWARQLSRTCLPSLRTLSCHSRVLNGLLPVPTHLTHLYITLLSISELRSIAPLIGQQLVSLRLGYRYHMGEISCKPLSLDEVLSSFPRLRFLQVGMDHAGTPYLDEKTIQWRMKRPRTRRRTSGTTASRVTLAWVYARPKNGDVELMVAATWHQFLSKAALEVLREWSDRVDRIVWRHTIIPYVSVSLSEDEMRVVRVQDREMQDDHWKFV